MASNTAEQNYELRVNVKVMQVTQEQTMYFGCLSVRVTEIISKLLAECFGTAFLVLFGCMSCVAGFVENEPTHVGICLTFGLAVMLIIQIFGHVSGGHINPAVTAAAMVLRVVSIKLGIGYMVVQFIGAVLGIGTLKLLTPDKNWDLKSKTGGMCTTLPHKNLNDFQAAGVEFMSSLALVWVCCGVWDHRNIKKHDSVALRIGLAITGLALATIQYTSASMNPARSFGPALINMHFDSYWVYFVAPFVAGVVGGFSYRLLFWKPRDLPMTSSTVEQVPSPTQNVQPKPSIEVVDEV